MSTQQPSTPRRRRIAGERRSLRTPAETTSEAPAAPAAPRAERSSPPKPPRTRRPRAPRPAAAGWWGSPVSLVALGLSLVVLLAAVGLAAFGALGNDSIADVRRYQAVEAAQESAPATAERAAAALLVYDHRHLDADKDAALPFLTSSFAEEYENTFEKVVRPTALRQKARVTAEVQASAVIRATPTTARVLVFVDQTTISTAHAGPRTALNRVEMDLVKQGDSWRVKAVSAF